MNINAVRLILVGSIIMYKILMLIIAVFECAQVNSIFFGHDSLPLVFMNATMQAFTRITGLRKPISYSLVV